ncbi:hypothetical protein [Emcibacter sp. SYSU 3D8]|uniref:hypothetical protein n=1 Tax=Emcibacter sp. SYSU 3D8 TaxID=3133969 RepID=UPI0031FF38ED
MNWDAVTALAEVAGAAAVVISLLYVARQLRQSANFTRATSQQMLIDKTTDHNRWICEDPQRIEILRRAVGGFHDLPPNEQHLVYTVFSAFLTGLENAIYFRQAGVCPDAVYAMQERTAMLILRTRGGQEFWESGQFLIGDDVRHKIEDLLKRKEDGMPPLHMVMPWLGTASATA